MQNAPLAAEAALPLPALNASAEASLETVNDVIDAYMRDVCNPFAERKRKDPGSIGAHFIPIRAVWGDIPIAVFRRGSKARVKLQGEEWRRGGWKRSTCANGGDGSTGAGGSNQQRASALRLMPH